MSRLVFKRLIRENNLQLTDEEKKREDTCYQNLGNTVPTDFKRMTIEYHEQFYFNKFDHLYEIDKFLEKHTVS